MRRIVWILAVTVLVVLVGAAISTPILGSALGRSMWRLVYAYRWWIPAGIVVVAAVLLGWLLAAFLRQPSGSTQGLGRLGGTGSPPSRSQRGHAHDTAAQLWLPDH